MPKDCAALTTADNNAKRRIESKKRFIFEDDFQLLRAAGDQGMPRDTLVNQIHRPELSRPGLESIFAFMKGYEE